MRVVGLRCFTLLHRLPPPERSHARNSGTRSPHATSELPGTMKNPTQLIRIVALTFAAAAAGCTTVVEEEPATTSTTVTEETRTHSSYPARSTTTETSTTIAR